MPLLAHIGKIPVEEWLPFVVPVVVLYLVGRRTMRRRERAVRAMPEASELLDRPTVERVLARWRQTRHTGLAARHVPIFYPPGPDGLTPAQLAERSRAGEEQTRTLLEELQELGYLDQGDGEVWLTVEGYDVLSETESVLLEAAKERQASRAGR